MGVTPLRLAVIPGDGVGPEVVEESLRVLQYIDDEDPDVAFTFTLFPWGTDYYLEQGEMMPADGLEILQGFDAILFGAVGSPRVKDHITLRELLLRIRFGFDQYVNLRPIRLLPGVDTPLAGIEPADLDIVFVREATEGEYADIGEWLHAGTEREAVHQTAVFSRVGVERVARWAFEYARREDRRSVTSVSKANALRYSGVLWDDVFDEVASDYPEIETQRLLVDAAAMLLVRYPRRFDVIVASNLYADILTDLGAALMGGMGLAPSANLNPERRHPSMFEPIHGSAPDIQGTGMANPIGSIWSSALMLAHLGLAEWAERVLGAVEATVADRATRTPDLGGSARTSDVGLAVVRNLEVSA